MWSQFYANESPCRFSIFNQFSFSFSTVSEDERKRSYYCQVLPPISSEHRQLWNLWFDPRLVDGRLKYWFFLSLFLPFVFLQDRRLYLRKRQATIVIQCYTRGWKVTHSVYCTPVTCPRRETGLLQYCITHPLWVHFIWRVAVLRTVYWWRFLQAYITGCNWRGESIAASRYPHIRQAIQNTCGIFSHKTVHYTFRHQNLSFCVYSTTKSFCSCFLIFPTPRVNLKLDMIPKLSLVLYIITPRK